ncbi:solute carrier family 2, facilitated glucose transporter member 11-like [Hemicordylus capensis]|uniref:solute carrier family 2, facilitated glucose transporter member 11-like n=1 Tax=Hemicordylus capensis TaxID=884348 RepID=UPI002302B88B|nr:solute carrier family 2, facilitated glucose transporter member 11-like [Hemicordylus capensis]
MTNFCSDLVLYRRVLQMSIILGLGGTFLFGFQVSMINYTSPYIKKFINETWLERYNAPIDEESLTLLWSFIVSAFGIGGLIGTFLSGYLPAKYGKKNCLIFCSVLMLATAVIMSTSKMAKSFEMILLGRLLYGLNAGLGCCIQGQYLGEISPKHLRGLTNVTVGVLANLGKFLGQLSGLRELLGTESLWPILLATSGATGLVLLFTVPFFPETPPYLLIQKGDLEGCLKALNQLWGEGDHKAEVDDMLKEQASIKKAKIMNVLELLKDHSMRHQLCLLIVVGTTLSLSGVNAIYFYSSDVFYTSGLDPERISYVALGAGACELCSILICLFTIEHFGRRKMLLWGYGLMMLVLALLTATLSLQHHFFWMPYCNVALIFLFIIIFGSGPAGVTFPVIVELFTQSSRPAALVISMGLHWTGLNLIGMFFPYVVNHLGTFCFLIFMGYIAVSWVLIFWFLPETKGKSLMEIQGEFNQLKMGKKKDTAIEKNSPEELMCTRL